MLQPDPPFHKELRNRTRDQQRHARIHRAGRETIIAVGKVPKVVGDDPEPKLIRPDHVLGLRFGNADAHPPRHGQHEQHARNRIEDVPRPAEQGQPRAVGCQRLKVVEHLQIAEDRLDDVDAEDRNRKKCGEFRVAKLGIANCHKADDAKQGGVGLHHPEPGLAGRAADNTRGNQPDQYDWKHAIGQNRDDLTAARDFVEQHQRGNDRKYGQHTDERIPLKKETHVHFLQLNHSLIGYALQEWI